VSAFGGLSTLVNNVGLDIHEHSNVVSNAVEHGTDRSRLTLHEVTGKPAEPRWGMSEAARKGNSRPAYGGSAVIVKLSQWRIAGSNR
jgi:hypothetical protein